MRKITALSLVFFMAAGGRVMVADDHCCGKGGESASSEKKCCHGQRVSHAPGSQEDKVAARDALSSVLASWKAATEAEKACCPTAAAQVKAEYAGAAQSCPVTSRLGTTLLYTKSVLDAAAAAGRACNKFCAAAKAPGAAGCEAPCALPASSAAEGARLEAQRAALLGSLQQLASYAASTLPSGAAPAQEAKACSGAAAPGCAQKTVAAEGACCGGRQVQTSAGCPAACGPHKCGSACACGDKPCGPGCGEKCGSDCACGSGCCEDCATALLNKGKQLEASWGKAAEERATQCPVKKKEVMASIDSLGKRSKAVALLPETAVALSAGVAELDDLNEKIVVHMKANPATLNSVPEEARKLFERQKVLIREAREVLAGARAAITAERETSPAEKKSVARDG